MLSSLTNTMCRGGTAAAMAMVLSMGCADGDLGDNGLMGPEFMRGGGGATVDCAIGTDVATSPTITELCDDTAGTLFLNDRIRYGLIGKLNLASSKLGEEKIADAVQKLQDYVSNLTAMRIAAVANLRKAKVDPAVAQALIDGAQAIIDFLAPPEDG